jgi:hypothetical protein
MSDRRRRWICQLVFVGVCVLPTAWVLLSIIYRPRPAHYAQQLQLLLGVPVTVQSVTTPTPELTLLQGVELWHPETGVWAVADRWLMLRDSPSAVERWQISRLRVREETLLDFGQQLHNAVVRQRLNAHGANSLGGTMPTLHVQSLEVVSGGERPDAAGNPLPGPDDSHVAFRLKDVAVSWQGSSEDPWPRMELAAKVVPPGAERDFLSTEVEPAEVPLLCYLERRGMTAVEAPLVSYVTQWEVAVPDRPLPLAWLKPATWPTFLGQRSAASFHGLLSGAVAEQRWWLNCQQARLEGLDLSDLEFFLTGQRTESQAPARLRIHHVGWSGGIGGAAQWEACDVELQAGEGQLDGQLVRTAALALALSAPQAGVLPLGLAGETATPATLRFAEMNVGVRLRDGVLWLRPLEGTGQNLPLLNGFNGKDQVVWGNRGERAWRPDAPAPTQSALAEHLPITGAAATAATAAAMGASGIAQTAATEERDPLEIAAVDWAWEPPQFIIGVPVADRFPFQPIAVEPGPGVRTAPVSTETIRAFIENPRLGTDRQSH